jgi:hypothetical protein
MGFAQVLLLDDFPLDLIIEASDFAPRVVDPGTEIGCDPPKCYRRTSFTVSSVLLLQF